MSAEGSVFTTLTPRTMCFYNKFMSLAKIISGDPEQLNISIEGCYRDLAAKI